ncbi:MAG: DUF4369 domain-containing protein [Bacteroidales bacterium]|jgi:hypothetical protein|nr:DUF4369 domain-containing protein [Bacteroidales bacterium]
MKVIPVVCLSFLAVSCISKDTLTVNGTVDDPALNNTKVYFVASDGPVTHDVDSAIIIDGRFRFVKKADSMRVRIVRVPVRFPGALEDLVTVLEKGTIDVDLSANSRGGGTRLNNRLQEWKDYKHSHDSLQSDLYALKRQEGTTKEYTDSLLMKSALLNQEYRSYVFNLMNENLHNGIGLLLFKVYYHEIAVEEKKRILDLTGNIYLEKDAQLRNMVMNDKSLNPE